MSTSTMKFLFSALMVLSALLFPAAAQSAAGDVGIVLLHGKWGEPSSLAPLARELESNGYKVDAPMMPWGRPRMYDADYPAALAEIDAAVKSLRQEGAKRIIVAGQSFGANASIAYAASGREVDGVIAMAPGHVVDRTDHFASSVAKAHQMIAEGKGNEKAWFDDVNQGKSRTIQTTAVIYLSYFDPGGIAAMSKSAARIPKPVPFLMVVGTQDRMFKFGERYIFNRVPKHPSNKYVVVESGHRNTPSAGMKQIVEWINSLGY